MPPGRPKRRKANDPPTIGQPTTRLVASAAPAKESSGDLIFCPCGCDGFVSRTTAWRHAKGKSIPARAKAVRALRSLASAGKDLWQNVKAKLSSAPTSPASQQNSSMGSPMAVDTTTVLDGSEQDGVGEASPQLSEWATHHHRTTVEDVPEDDDDSSSDEGEDGDQEGTEMREEIRERERENEYRENDQENDEVDELVEEAFESSVPDLQEKLTEEQIQLLRAFVVGEGRARTDPLAEVDDIRRLEFERKLAAIGEHISPEDLKLVRAFALKIQDNLTEATFNKFQYVFPESHTESYKLAKARIVLLACFNPLVFDMCVKSCIAYTGPNYSDLQSCPKCGQDRFCNGKPRKRYVYIPLIPRLQAMFKVAKLQEEMQYRHKYETEKRPDGEIQDIFDGSNYRTLKGMFVDVDGTLYHHTFFNDARDIAIGFSTDGFCPFKHRKQTCWPIIIFNYNLPPELRFGIHRILCVGVVPGPNKPADFDSFLWPLVQELLQLAAGVKTFDKVKSELFMLRAYPIVGFGDYPAISMVLQMKGHNGIFPCRMCLIEGLRIPGHRSNTHYVPLKRSNHPDVIANATRRKVVEYDPNDLPLRTSTQFMKHARLVQFAESEARADELSMGCGIKGIPLLSCLPSLFFPTSFPFDFMHLVYENLIKNLVKLWTGTFKDLDHEDQDYYLTPSVWSAIGAATAQSGSTIPSAYGARPRNIAEKASHVTADAWSFWALYLGPVLLQRRFKNADFYNHFIELVKLINLCLLFTITKEQIQQIRTGFQKWVVEYERLYYQEDPGRLSTCPVTVHALLHIADGIEACGPVWAYWAFPMERFCGFLGKAIKNRRFPFANLDTYCVSHAQLSHICNRFNLHETLSFKPSKETRARTETYINSPEYQGYALVQPCYKNVELTPGMKDKIVGALATKFKTNSAAVEPYFDPASVEIYGRLRQTFSEAGETMIASCVVSPTQDDHRDASFVRYVLEVDVNAKHRNMPVQFTDETSYGQLLYLFLVRMPCAPPLGITAPQAVALAAIQHCDVELEDANLDIHYYQHTTYTEVVEVQAIQALVGRVAWDGWWAIIDRSGGVQSSDA